MFFILAAIAVQFEQSSYIIDEDDGPVQLVLIFSNPSSTNITVQVENIFGNATGRLSRNEILILSRFLGGTDYNSTQHNITFTTGVTRVQFNVAIIDDSLFESDEIFYLIITTDSLPNGVSVGYPNQTTVTIEDDEGNCN